MHPSDQDPALSTGRVGLPAVTHPEPDVYAFRAAVTVTLRGTEFCTISIALPGAQPFTVVCSQSYALDRAIYESTASIAAIPNLPRS